MMKQADLVVRQEELEQLFEQAYLDRDVFIGEDSLLPRWPDDLDGLTRFGMRLENANGRIFAEASTDLPSVRKVEMIKGLQIADGPYDIVLMPRFEEYYMMNIRIQRRMPLWVAKGKYSYQLYGENEQRRREALQDAARRGPGLFSEIARMQLEDWNAVRQDVIEAALEGIGSGGSNHMVDLIGALMMIYRFGDHSAFPQFLRKSIETSILDFDYALNEVESHQILSLAAQVLAGQRYPTQTFLKTSQPGTWHQETASQQALDWLLQRGTMGFQAWDSPDRFEETALALVVLVDFAELDALRELAAVVLDKLLFTLALNSYRGTFGSTRHGLSDIPVHNGRLEATTGICRLLWGMGVFNSHIAGTVSLACSEAYEVPTLIQAVALDPRDALWSKENQAGAVNKVTYRTPDYMLCSAQDYRPGEPGHDIHVWQATLGPDALVFVNHPANSHNVWQGNGLLPRAAQWQDALMAVHQLPEDDPAGYTHAYFPTYAFDEYVLRDGWAFARKDDAFLALTAQAGFDFITTGRSAYRELRSYGTHNTWLCQMGRAAMDGSFAEFQERILALDVQFDDSHVRWTTLRGDTLEFGGSGPLRVNQKEESISNFKHYDNPYCVAETGDSAMEIRYADFAMRLNFAL